MAAGGILFIAGFRNLLPACIRFGSLILLSLAMSWTVVAHFLARAERVSPGLITYPGAGLRLWIVMVLPNFSFAWGIGMAGTLGCLRGPDILKYKLLLPTINLWE